MSEAAEVDEAQVASFRAHRGHLAGPGADDLPAAARAVVGIQAQVDGWAGWSVAMRTAGTPTADAVQAAVLDDRALVKLWAQRDTLHLYPTDDWPWVAAVDPLWPMSGRRGALPPDEVLDEALARMADGPITRSDVLDLVTEEMFADMASRVPEDKARRYAAGRIPWALVHRGLACVGPTVGTEQAYVARDRWLPGLAFPEHDPEHAALHLVRRYLAVNGPATYADIAHYLGTTRTLAKRWVKALGDQLVDVRCGDRKGLLALASDVDALTAEPEPTPARLVAAYDTLLMAHHDKSWTVPDEAERTAVWRRFAHVSAVVLAGGRVVATWEHKALKRSVRVTVTPLTGWSEVCVDDIRNDARRLAHHLGRDEAETRVS